MKKLLLSCLCMLGMGVASAATVTDVFTASSVGVEKKSSYADYNNVTLSSSAVYAVNCTKNADDATAALQFRSDKNTSGIVSTTSGGYVSKVEVTWNAATNTSRKLNIYGSNTPFSTPGDLYSESTQGTLIGQLAYGETTLTVGVNYKYIGIRSNYGAEYFDNISITWSNAEVGEDPGEENPPVVDPDPTTYEEVANIAAWLAKADTANDVKITGPVTVIYQNGKNLYVKDNSGYLLVFFPSTPSVSYTNGNVLTGIVGKYVDYNGLPEMTPVATSFGNALEGDAVEPYEIMIGDVNAEPLSAYIEINDVTVGEANGRYVPISDASGDEINLYNTFNLPVPEPGDNYTVRGFVSIYKGTYQIAFTEVLNPQALVTVATPTFSVPSGAIPAGTAVAIECATAGADIYYTINESTEKVIYTEPIVIEEATTIMAYAVKDGMTDSEVAIATYSILEPISNNARVSTFVAGTFDAEGIQLLNNNDLPTGESSAEETSICGKEFADNYVGICIEKGGSNYWSFVATDQVRWYKGATMTITPAEGRTIRSIEFFVTGNDYVVDFVATAGGKECGVVNLYKENKVVTWQGSVEEPMVLTTNGQIRFNTMVIVTDGEREVSSQGDVNGDGTVDATDIAMLIEIMLGTSSGDGDVTGDGNIDASDIAMLISLILGE